MKHGGLIKAEADLFLHKKTWLEAPTRRCKKKIREAQKNEMYLWLGEKHVFIFRALNKTECYFIFAFFFSFLFFFS